MEHIRNGDADSNRGGPGALQTKRSRIDDLIEQIEREVSAAHIESKATPAGEATKIYEVWTARLDELLQCLAGRLLTSSSAILVHSAMMTKTGPWYRNRVVVDSDSTHCYELVAFELPAISWMNAAGPGEVPRLVNAVVRPDQRIKLGRLPENLRIRVLTDYLGSFKVDMDLRRTPTERIEST